MTRAAPLFAITALAAMALAMLIHLDPIAALAAAHP
jgi:hypothetical protein